MHPSLDGGTHPVRTIAIGIRPDQLDDGHLHELVHRIDRLGRVQQVLDGAGMRDATQGYKSIPLASDVGFLYAGVKLGSARAIDASL